MEVAIVSISTLLAMTQEYANPCLARKSRLTSQLIVSQKMRNICWNINNRSWNMRQSANEI
jgi:hypothetical protein